ncbi:Origin recognition complex subunit 4 [Tolypocladium capitatum]|uniref:Origin recognition complex subunit 4 n=1 Tax=Tolypocladium capitatum TaxID=45235 RepID=A0A2K3QM87_9HYPO|nr:Origin recognition complex subunit 4 [Tolypocladium capitatum]
MTALARRLVTKPNRTDKDSVVYNRLAPSPSSPPRGMAMDHDAATTPPTNRKRTLPQAGPEPVSTPASIKRRKLGDAGAESPSTPKALNAIASAISGAFGYGRQQPDPADGDAAATQGQSLNGHGLAPGPQPQAPIPPLPDRRPSIKLAALRGTRWDRGDLGDARMAKKPATPPRRAPAKSSPASGKGRGRAQNGELDSPSKGRSSPLLNGFAVDDGRESTDEPWTPTGRGLAVRKSLLASVGRIPPPKGILTPTKRRGRPPKSVAFNRGLDGQVYLEERPKTPSAKKPRSSNAKRAAEEEDDDDIRCAICSKADSRPPNQIILCDNCDFAVHQECYEVPEIPEGDWLCKSCAQEDVLKTPSKPTDAASADAAAAVEVPDVPNLSQHLRSFQRVLLDRCSGRRRMRIFGQEEAYEKAWQLVEQTVVAGEGNSMLLIGPRGCGKTTVRRPRTLCPNTFLTLLQMVENIILDLSREHRNLFHVVRLNGFIHTDDKLALKEIWRQLGKEMEVEDDLVNRTNYADTMASLLALLSHPSEIMATDEGVTSQSVIFVIDEFDMFAAHPRQTLLYNLFDIAQSRKAPVAVLGCTTRLDVVEMLEKRVKSRFSHRYVYLSPPRGLAAYWQICRQGLMIDKTDVEREGVDVTLEGYDEFHKYWTHKIEASRQAPSGVGCEVRWLTLCGAGTLQAEAIPEPAAVPFLYDEIGVGVLDGMDIAAVVALGNGRDPELPVGGDVAGAARLAAAPPVHAVGPRSRAAHRGGPAGRDGAHGHGQLRHGVRRVQLAGGQAEGAVGDVGNAGGGRQRSGLEPGRGGHRLGAAHRVGDPRAGRLGRRQGTGARRAGRPDVEGGRGAGGDSDDGEAGQRAGQVVPRDMTLLPTGSRPSLHGDEQRAWLYLSCMSAESPPTSRFGKASHITMPSPARVPSVKWRRNIWPTCARRYQCLTRRMA